MGARLRNVKLENVEARLRNVRARLGTVRLKNVKPQRSFSEADKARHLQLHLLGLAELESIAERSSLKGLTPKKQDSAWKSDDNHCGRR